jgi:HEAT repeat protein
LLLAYDQIFALGPRAAPLLPLVISHIGHPEYAVRMAALECIVAIAPAPTENIIAPLLNAATADDSPVRIRAGDALAAIAPGDHRTIAALAAALSDPRPAVRNSAAYHLGEIGPPALATVPALEVLRDDPDTQVAKTAALALVRIRR